MTPVVLAFAPMATAPDGPRDAMQDLVFLADDRPVFLRLKVTIGDRPFRAVWPDSVRAIHACLDRDGDGTVTVKEADPAALAAIVRLATAGATALPRGEIDSRSKDGIVSLDELADALRPAVGPFRVQVGRVAGGRTDALFEYLDRDKDDQLTRPEMAALVGALRRLDLDDNEMISAEELDPFHSPAAIAADEVSQSRARFTALPPVVELVAGESTLRPARLLLKKYDKGRENGPGPPDNKLSRSEFAIDPAAFAAADTSGDDTLSVEELRAYLAGAPNDLSLDVVFSPDSPGQAVARVGGDGVSRAQVKILQITASELELSFGSIRLDILVDNGDTAAFDARRVFTRRFTALDMNKDGYLEANELARDNGPAALFTGLFEVIDRDADGKLYLKELADFVDRQVDAARGRLVLSGSDQGRAIFGILDLNRDRRLGAREILRTVDRVSSWDRDGDGRVSAEEIPYHFRVTLSRGLLSGLVPSGLDPASMGSSFPKASESAAGPSWFRKMDRNKDGDISRREFLGPREDFDRLDRDKDGLIGADEAEAGP